MAHSYGDQIAKHDSALATPHPKVCYVQGIGDDLNVVPEIQFSVVTLAGSLSYTKTDALKGELLRTLGLGPAHPLQGRPQNHLQAPETPQCTHKRPPPIHGGPELFERIH